MSINRGSISTRIINAFSLLVVILCIGACTGESKATKGLLVDVATSSAPCGDSRNVIAVAMGGHRARLNIEPDASIPEVTQRLREIMSTRAEKVVFVKAQANVSWGDFLELVDHVWPEADVVSIFTPQVEALARQTYCLSPSCRDCTGFGGFRPRNR